MRNLLLIFLFLLSILSFSQNALRFNNIVTADTVWVFENDKVIIKYTGYLSQIEEINGKVLEINDSIIIIGSKIFAVKTIFKQVEIANIQGFRKITKSQIVFKTILNVGVLAGSIYLPNVFVGTNFLQNYLISFSSGLFGFGVSNIIYPTKIKNTKNTAWKCTIMYPTKF